MERVIRDITEQLIEKLPEEREFYTPEDLQVLDIPEFITERLVIEMDQNLNESLETPTTEWADMSATSVRFAWKNFLEAIKAEVKMPATYAKSLFETAVADTLELASRPRQAIPENLFGADEEISIDQVKKRIKYITVGRKLAAALVRYMEKKGKTSLTLNECSEIVAKVDEKLIAGYNSLDWAKETEALFQLAGPKVDPELLRIYFDDKGIMKYADKFDRIRDGVSRTFFIEILSAPDIEKDDTVSNKESANEGLVPNHHKSPKKTEQRSAKRANSIFLPDDSILNSFQKRRFSSIEEEEEYYKNQKAQEADDSLDDESDELHKKFRFDEDAAEKEKIKVESEKKSSIYDEMNLRKEEKGSNSNIDSSIPGVGLDPDLIKKWKMIGGEKGIKKDDEDLVLSEKERPDSDDDGVASIELYNETEDDEEVPMWRAFLEREDLTKVKENEAGFDESTFENTNVDEGSVYQHDYDDPYDDEPIIDLTKEPESINDKIQEIEMWIGDDISRFAEEIFDGSDAAVEDALANVVEFEDWKSASKYLQKEIFDRNRIDVFSEVAVDFTDRLHTFFLEYKS